MTAPEIVPNLPERDYHNDDTTLSASAAKILLGKRPPAADSDALKFGTLVHVAILEPDRLSEYVSLDASSIRKADGGVPTNPTMTAEWRRLVTQAEEDGLTVVTQADYDRALNMRAAVLAHPTARRILDMATDVELSCYADHPTGARVRGRLDISGPVIADIKTSRDADPDKFGRIAHDYGYHISAANYLDIAAACGLRADRLLFINVEKQPTLSGQHRVSVTELTADAIDLGREQMAEACRRWLALDRRIDLPDYPTEIQTVDLPGYAYWTADAEVELKLA